MSATVLATPRNTDADWEIDAQTSDALGNTAPATGMLGTDGLEAVVWAGDAQSPLFHPTVAWLNAPAGQVRLSVAASQTTNLATGLFPLEITWLPPGSRRPLFAGWFELLDAPGAGSPPPSYCTYQDCLGYAQGEWLRALLLTQGMASLLFQIGRARSWLDDLIVDKYRPSLYREDLRTYGWAGFANMESQSPTIRGYLTANQLMVRDRTKEICAHKALGLLCDGQIGGESNDPYVARAVFHHTAAHEMVKTYRAEIDINADGFADLAFHLGVHSLR